MQFHRQRRRTRLSTALEALRLHEATRKDFEWRMNISAGRWQAMPKLDDFVQTRDMNDGSPQRTVP